MDSSRPTHPHDVSLSPLSCCDASLPLPLQLFPDRDDLDLRIPPLRTSFEAHSFSPSWDWERQVPVVLDRHLARALASSESRVEVWHHCPRAPPHAASQAASKDGSPSGDHPREVFLASGTFQLWPLLSRPGGVHRLWVPLRSRRGEHAGAVQISLSLSPTNLERLDDAELVGTQLDGAGLAAGASGAVALDFTSPLAGAAEMHRRLVSAVMPFLAEEPDLTGCLLEEVHPTSGTLPEGDVSPSPAADSPPPALAAFARAHVFVEQLTLPLGEDMQVERPRAASYWAEWRFPGADRDEKSVPRGPVAPAAAGGAWKVPMRYTGTAKLRLGGALAQRLAAEALVVRVMRQEAPRGAGPGKVSEMGFAEVDLTPLVTRGARETSLSTGRGRWISGTVPLVQEGCKFLGGARLRVKVLLELPRQREEWEEDGETEEGEYEAEVALGGARAGGGSEREANDRDETASQDDGGEEAMGWATEALADAAEDGGGGEGSGGDRDLEGSEAYARKGIDAAKEQGADEGARSAAMPAVPEKSAADAAERRPDLHGGAEAPGAAIGGGMALTVPASDALQVWGITGGGGWDDDSSVVVGLTIESARNIPATHVGAAAGAAPVFLPPPGENAEALAGPGAGVPARGHVSARAPVSVGEPAGPPPRLFATVEWGSGPPRVLTHAVRAGTEDSGEARCDWHFTQHFRVRKVQSAAQRAELLRDPSATTAILKVWSTAGGQVGQHVTPRLVGCTTVDISGLYLGMARVSGWYHLVDHLQAHAGHIKLSVVPSEPLGPRGDWEEPSDGTPSSLDDLFPLSPRDATSDQDPRVASYNATRDANHDTRHISAEGVAPWTDPAAHSGGHNQAASSASSPGGADSPLSGSSGASEAAGPTVRRRLPSFEDGIAWSGAEADPYGAPGAFWRTTPSPCHRDPAPDSGKQAPLRSPPEYDGHAAEQSREASFAEVEGKLRELDATMTKPVGGTEGAGGAASATGESEVQRDATCGGEKAQLEAPGRGGLVEGEEAALRGGPGGRWRAQASVTLCAAPVEGPDSGDEAETHRAGSERPTPAHRPDVPPHPPRTSHDDFPGFESAPARHHRNAGRAPGGYGPGHSVGALDARWRIGGERKGAWRGVGGPPGALIDPEGDYDSDTSVRAIARREMEGERGDGRSWAGGPAVEVRGRRGRCGDERTGRALRMCGGYFRRALQGWTDDLLTALM